MPPRSRLSSLNTTATIPGQDLPVFTTDSQQSTWLPSSSSSLPAPSAQQLQHQPQHLNLPPQQDFVLFDQPIRQRQPNRSVSQPSANGGVNNNQPSRNHQLFPSLPSLQNQRVASIIQATGHPATPSAFSNRLGSPAQNTHQFYASSAPSSSTALNLQRPNQNRSRPPVPLFTQSTGNIPNAKMNLSDLELEDFTAFEGGASTTAYSSPALPTVFDLGSSVSNMGTVSPHELMMSEPFLSAPNSTALTTLTSPSVYNDSPDFPVDSYQCSPIYGADGEVPDASGGWFSLFPEVNNNQQAGVKPERSPASQSDDLSPAESKPSHQRRKSANSPPSGRHSSVSGVNPRRRDKPLPPIVVEDPNDTIAMKRARNTLAARKSRERKAQRLDELEVQIEKLTTERDYWKERALALGATEE